MAKRIYGKLEVRGKLGLPLETANTVPVVDGSGEITSSAVTPTELARLSGVTGDIQTQLDAKIDESREGQSNGIATLDAGGKIPVGQLPNAVMTYEGTWDASTNTPTLADGIGDAGQVYRVNGAGTVDFGAGNISFEAGDYVIYSGTIWQKADGTDAVVSVNGLQGVVVLDTDDISEGVTNLYHTDERAQDAVGTILVDSASIDFTYNDATPSITAAVLPAGVDHDQLQNFVANEHIDHSTVEISTAINSGLAGGGDITANRDLIIDPNNAPSVTAASGDLILIGDVSDSNSLKKVTAQSIADLAVSGSAGDIEETSFAIANDQSTLANITGFAFANGVVRSFEALVSVEIDGTSDLFEVFEISGIQKGASWEISVESTGDISGILFDITNAGQMQYTSSDVAGFVSGSMKFRAITTSV